MTKRMRKIQESNSTNINKRIRIQIRKSYGEKCAKSNPSNKTAEENSYFKVAARNKTKKNTYLFTSFIKK